MLMGSLALTGCEPYHEVDSVDSVTRNVDTTIEGYNVVLEWNQVFIDTLIATNTANSASQRLGAIVHTAMFDAWNGIEGRYQPIFFTDAPEPGASKRAAVVAAAYNTLFSLFPSRRADLTTQYHASLDALFDGGDGGQSAQRGIRYGEAAAAAVLAWRATDGFSTPPPDFFGGTAIGQWRPLIATNPMAAQMLAFTTTFVVPSNTTFRPPFPRGLNTQTYTDDFNTVKALGPLMGSSRTADQTFLARFWDGNASVHWNEAANQIARANGLSTSQCNRLLAVLNLAMADTGFTTWSAKRAYAGDPTAVTWRPFTAIPQADSDGNPDTIAQPGWVPLITTPNHPEYPAGHPGLNGAGAAMLLLHFADAQTFTLTNGPNFRTYDSITQAREDANNARVWGGMHYPSTVAISDAEGEAIANYVNENAARSAHGK
jgi:hypothetical protein